MIDLYGFGNVILEGAKMTLKLALLSLMIAFLLGLIGASAKLSKHRFLRIWFDFYTTLARGVPEIVLMLIVFYGIQILLNSVTESLNLPILQMNEFVTGCLTLGIIYGAYFTETFRGAFISVDKGEIEAAKAFGLNRWQVFYRIVFPSMMRFALPGIGNNWLVLLKATALVSILALNDLVRNTQSAIASRETPNDAKFMFYAVAAGIYLLFTAVSSVGLWWLERHFNVGVKKSKF
ncbi:ABC transporter permease [Thorsellia kenyensis]|uniref:ABC transporter permease n=1 Tax=Thorsellia kenyensis TaxID=1549888 RepID=A0ABV6CCQ7_9GAMM